MRKFLRGQTLVELLLAMGLAALIFPALLSGFMSSREGKVQQGLRMQAVALLKETEQAVKSVHNNDWSTFAVNGTNHNKGKWCSPSFSTATIDLPDGPPVAVAATASAVSVNIPDEAFVATAPNTSNTIKMAYVRVDANTDAPHATISGEFTMDPAQ